MSTPKIFQQIPKIMQELEAISKERNNAQQGFKFRGIDDVYNELHPRLAKYSIFTAPEVLEERREERTTQKGGLLTYVILKMKYTFYADDGSSVSVVVIGEGMDSGDKASNKAMSVAHKYALIQIFAIPTIDDKDPDFESHEVKPKPVQQAAKPPQADNKPLVRTAPKTTTKDLGDYICPIGKEHSGKKLKDIDPFKLDGFLKWLTNKAEESRQPLSGPALELYKNAEAYLKSLEFGDPKLNRNEELA